MPAVLLVTLALTLTFGWSAARAGDEQPQTADVPQSLRDLAEEAKSEFRARVEPPLAKMIVFDIGPREEGYAERRYLLQSYGAAIDALVIEASRPEQLSTVQHALTRIVRARDPARAEALFAEAMRREAARGPAGARAAAAASRHGVALGELPKALAAFFSTLGGGYSAADKGTPNTGWGARALPAYLQAAALEPDEPWSWLVVAWLAKSREAKAAACSMASISAGLATDARARIELYRQRGKLYQQAGDIAHAREMFEARLKVAREAAAQPAGGIDVRALTMAMNALGDFHAATGNRSAARAAYEEALKAREDLARMAPASVEAGTDLIASHDRLRRLHDEANGSQVNQMGIELNLYQALAEHDRYAPMFGPDQWAALSSVVTLMGSAGTVIVGIILLVLYRRRLGQLMTSVAAQASGHAGHAAAMPPVAVGSLRLRVLNPQAAAELVQSPEGALANALTALRRAAWVQAAGALAFAVVAAELWMAASDIDMNPRRMVIFVTVWVWPLVLVLGLLWTGDRRRQGLVLGAYACALATQTLVFGLRMQPIAVHGVMLSGPLQLLYLWAGQMAPSAVLLIFVNRRVRAVGPVLLAFLLVTFLGGMLACVEASSYAGQRWTVNYLMRLNITMGTQTLVIFFIGMLIAAPFAWALIAAIRAVYRAKWISDQTLTFDSIWLVQALVLVLVNLAPDVGVFAWEGLAAFLAYKAVTLLGQLPLARAAAKRPKVRLLLLRVFGFRRRSERFFDVLSARWRYAGPIQLIAAPDLASKTIDPDELMDYLGGRLRQRFVIDHTDLRRRVDALDDKPDVDGRFRVNEFFCGQDGWRAAVRSLMVESDLVVMDLRGFTARNQGCIFELETLVDCVPAGRIVMLIDATTDEALLRATLDDCTSRIGAGSPNLTGHGMATLFEVGRKEIVAVNGLLRLADELLDAGSNAQTPSVAALCGRAGYFEGVWIPLPAEGLTLGRGLPEDGRLAFDERCHDISRTHCAVAYDEQAGCFEVTDLGSSNGTFLLPGGHRLAANEPIRCDAGQRVQLGLRNVIELAASTRNVGHIA